MGNTDSKVAFRQAVFRLQGADPLPPTGSPDSDAFFAQFWSIPTSADDVFTLLTPADIKRVRDSRPEAFIALFLAVFKQFVALATDQTWSVPPSSLVASLASRAGLTSPGVASPSVGTPGSGSTEGNRALHMLNCIRLLTRLIPFIFEIATQSDSALANLLDEPIAPAARATSPAATASDATDAQQGTPLGHVLVFTVVQLLFRPGFTVPSHIPLAPPNDPNVDVNDQLSWDVCQLVGQPIASPSSSTSSRKASITSQSLMMSPTGKQASDVRRPSSAVSSSSGQQSGGGGGTPANMSSNRIEVLRLLLVCLSRSMYLAPPDLSTTPPASSATASPTSASPTAATQSPRSPLPTSPATPPISPAPRHTATFSEMHRNPILAYLTRRASGSPIASTAPTSSSTRLPSAWAQLLVRSLLYAISSYTPSSTWVPYDYLVLPASDASTLAMLAAHVLCILTTAGASLHHSDTDNRVIGMLAGMSEDSARMLCRALVKLLAARRKGTGGGGTATSDASGGGQLLPGSAPTVMWFHEVLVLLYVLVQASETVCAEVDGEEIGDQVVAEVAGVLSEYQGQHEMNLLRISIHLLTSLTLKSTSHAALLTETIHHLMMQPAPHLAPLFPLLVQILRRLMYHHPPTHAAAECLVKLAVVLGQPRYISKGEHNWKLAVAVYELLEYALCVHESREVLDWCVAHRIELGAFVWCALESVEPRVVGKGKGKRKGEGWVPDATWYANWRAHVVLPHIEHVLTSTATAPAGLSQPSSASTDSLTLKSLDTLAAELSTFHKDPPPAIAAAVFDEQGMAGSPTVVAWLPGFVWGAVYVRHRPGEGRVGVWAGTTPKVFKVQVVGPATPAPSGTNPSAPGAGAPVASGANGVAS